MLTPNPVDLESERLLQEILKDKPETPQCGEDEEKGRPLVWTKTEGWRVK